MKQCKSSGCTSMAVNVDPDRELCDVCFYKIPLRDLLAVIHRDSGDYTWKYGIKKSAADASRIVSNLITHAEAHNTIIG